MRVAALEWEGPLVSLSSFYAAFKEKQKAQVRKSKAHRALYFILRSGLDWLVAMEMQDGGLKIRSLLDLLSDYFAVKMSDQKVSKLDRRPSQERTFYIFPGESGGWGWAYLSQNSYYKGRLSPSLIEACEKVRLSSDFSRGPISICGNLKTEVLAVLTFYAKLARVPENEVLKIQDKSSISRLIRQLIKELWDHSFHSYNMSLEQMHRQPPCFFLVYYGQFSTQGESRYLTQEKGLDSTLANEIKSCENSWHQKCRWAWEIANGLYRLHLLGQAHLNLRPAYIFINRQRIAKIAFYWLTRGDKDEKRASLYVGPLQAPELAVGQPYDKYAVDLFLYGKVLESMVAGDPHLHNRTGPHVEFFQAMIQACCNPDPAQREPLVKLIAQLQAHCQCFNFSLRFDRLNRSAEV